VEKELDLPIIFLESKRSIFSANSNGVSSIYLSWPHAGRAGDSAGALTSSSVREMSRHHPTMMEADDALL